MTSPFGDNPALFGSDPREGIVAVERAGDDRVALYCRGPEGVAAEQAPFRPFLLLEGPSQLQGWGGPAAVQELEGAWDYRALAVFPSWSSLESAVKYLGAKTGMTRAAPDAPFFLIADPVQQYLTASGRTLYKGMRFEDVVRLQLDIETTVTPGYEFPSAQREGDRITLVSLSDSRGWEESLRGDRLSEAEMLEQLTALIHERDPDVIEGHNVFNFDLPYLAARARRFGLRLGWGRDGSPVKSRPSRLAVADRVIQYQRADVHGRHVIDTLFLVQFYDVGTRELESFGLKEAARHLGVAAPGRVYVDRREIPHLFETDMDRLIAYGLDDVRETREISRILGQSHFYQTQMFPLSHQNVVLRGNATRIDGLLLREYLRRRHAVPKPPERLPLQGGYTDLFVTGVVAPVVHCDVQSLYPSLMLCLPIASSRDDLGVLPALLADLTHRRLEAKARARSPSTSDPIFWDALQGALKVLINSFYGYLAFPQGHFADFEAAGRVTAEGRSLVRGILDTLRGRGATPIEVDTDGVYFSPPNDVIGEHEERALVAELSRTLPEGIRLDVAGRYRAMFSYKVKNYVLLTYDGALRIRGSGLRSRGIEKFQRLFMEEVFRALLDGRPDHARTMRDLFLDDLRSHRWTPELFAKTETLHDSLASYLEKRARSARNTSAAYELALASGRPFQPGDQITYYVKGKGRNVRVFECAGLASEWDPGHPDENTAYYAKKLEDLYRKFLPFLEPGCSAPPGKAPGLDL